MDDVGWSIREAMSRARIRDVKELAKITGLSYRTLARRFHHPGELRLYELEAIAGSLGITIGELVGGIK